MANYVLAARWHCEACSHTISHKYVSFTMNAQANNRRTSWLVAALVPCLLLLSLSSVRHVTAAAAVASVAPSKATASTADQTTVDEMVDEYMDDEDEFEDSLAGDGKAADGTPKKKSTSKRKKKATLKNQVVEFAPAAIVVFGDDIDDEGRIPSCLKEYLVGSKECSGPDMAPLCSLQPLLHQCVPLDASTPCLEASTRLVAGFKDQNMCSLPLCLRMQILSQPTYLYKLVDKAASPIASCLIT